MDFVIQLKGWEMSLNNAVMHVIMAEPNSDQLFVSATINLNESLTHDDNTRYDIGYIVIVFNDNFMSNIEIGLAIAGILGLVFCIFGIMKV